MLQTKSAMDHKMIKDIYDSLADNVSKEIFECRLMGTLTGDELYTRRLVHSLPESAFMLAQLKLQKSGEVFLFGGGLWGKLFTRIFPEIEIRAIVDNSAESIADVNGIEIIAPDKLKQFEHPYIIITSIAYYKEMEEQLRSLDFDERNWFSFGRVLRSLYDKQYFDLSALPKHRKLFVDCGALDGMTSRAFAKWNGDFKKILLFEPSKEQNRIIESNLKDFPNHQIINKGLWDSATIQPFNIASEGKTSAVVERDGENTISIETVSLDDVIENGEDAYIKMDIEGSEMKALLGAEKTIRKWHPTMAVSVYHRANDIIEIPSLLKEYNPDYKLYLRHYSFAGMETVLYAI